MTSFHKASIFLLLISLASCKEDYKDLAGDIKHQIHIKNIKLISLDKNKVLNRNPFYKAPSASANKRNVMVDSSLEEILFVGFVSSSGFANQSKYSNVALIGVKNNYNNEIDPVSVVEGDVVGMDKNILLEITSKSIIFLDTNSHIATIEYYDD